ncbi:MAG: peptidylprolyl isomerase [Casimicrobiaceae bacterium]|nr:peptidylprolyl isomerase [Casimicrobiaceae bacterium]MCX8097757.1 peptidylprolyl isomerase [Casimicrobiaceae bacterium]MDW8312725.1 peptidylprolyl isomerase [Burkholderiales bacterium]
MLTRFSLFVFAVVLISLSTSLAQAQSPSKPRVELKTSLGTIVLELDRAAAPKTVDNFLEYVRSGHYDGTVFHRVIKDFMAQGGGYDRDLKAKPTRAPIVNEGEQAEKAGLKNDRGTIAMARTADPHSATAQFFINFKDNAFLNHSAAQAQIPPPCKVPNPVPGCARFGWGYTAFGRVVSGMDVVDKMAEIPTGAGGPFPTDVPKTPIVIERATILTP